MLPDPKRPRLFNLRIYESHNERAAATKIHMFENGEIEIFKKVGLTPVFFYADGHRSCPAEPHLHACVSR